MDDRQRDLSRYRIQGAKDSLQVAENCLKDGLYRDSVNRSYYAAFYGVKAVLAMGTVDFKRHKDVMGYFNREFVATGIFPRELGRRLGALKQMREKSDYDDFYIISKAQAEAQFETARSALQLIVGYLEKIG